MRSSHAATVIAALALVGAGQQVTAQASEAVSQGEVTIKRATTTSLTLTWRGFSGAKEYLVERGTDLDMSARRQVMRTEKRRVTVSGLEPGALHCFQVRGVNGSEYGVRSRNVCQRTIAEEGDTSGPTYRIVNYNICSSVCAGWNSRRPAAAALVAARKPDVVMLQEAKPDSGMAQAIGGMVQVQAESGKALLYRRDRFDLATRNGDNRTGIIDLGRTAHSDNHREAVWAELVDRESRQHVVFVSVHLAPGDNADAATQRAREADNLVQGIARINPGGLPVVVSGDFNSHQGRKPDTPGTVMTGAGFANSFFRAHRWVRGKVNSANGGKLVPREGAAWGYHLDQVWADPERTQVLVWRNAAEFDDGQYAAPLPSNHNPVLVKLRVNH